MIPPLPTAAVPPPLPRSIFVTVLAWCVIVLSGLTIPISVISTAMIAVGSYGTKTIEPLGALIVLAGPPATFVAGIGLLRRKWWAWLYLLIVLAAILANNIHGLIQGPYIPYSYVSADGVTNNVISSGPRHSSPLMLVCLVLICVLLFRRIRSEFPFPRFGNASRGPGATAPSGEHKWRVGHQGRDGMYYEEFRDGIWQRIDIEGEMLMGRAHHVIYFASPERWQSYPEWARHRRAEIIVRIQSEFRTPDYEYHGAS